MEKLYFSIWRRRWARYEADTNRLQHRQGRNRRWIQVEFTSHLSLQNWWRAFSFLLCRKGAIEKIEYATLTVATIYSLDGTKKEIIREIYENDVDWTDSEGTLIERFAVKDGEIYGFGRRISGSYKFFSITMIIMENYWKRRRYRDLKTSSARNNLWIFAGRRLYGFSHLRKPDELHLQTNVKRNRIDHERGRRKCFLCDFHNQFRITKQHIYFLYRK